MSSYLNNITGVVLAGGRSSRFGSNKAFAVFQETPFIQRILYIMATVFSDLLLVTNTPEAYRHLSFQIVSDHRPYQGPMGGIATALRVTSHPLIFVVGCDMPLIRSMQIREIAGQGQDFSAVLATRQGQREFLFGLYSKELLPRMEEFLNAGRLSLKEFFADLPGVLWVPVEGEGTSNVNTPQDLRDLEERHAL